MKHLPLLLTVSFALAACTQANGQLPTEKIGDLQWTAAMTGEGTTGEPHTKVTLVDASDGSELYSAECIGTISENPTPGAKLSVMCWWAGGGEEFAVFDSGSTLSLKHRYVDEESGYTEWIDQSLNI
jgi:hypothetical protein